MTRAIVVEPNPAFRALTAALRDYHRMIAACVDHLGFDISLMESGRKGALQFVILFSPRAGAQADDVRIVFAATGEDQVAIAVRGPGGGRTLGSYRLGHLAGASLRGVIDTAITEATDRVRTLAATRARSQDWQEQRA
jgi:hypothetical protein